MNSYQLSRILSKAALFFVRFTIFFTLVLYSFSLLNLFITVFKLANDDYQIIYLTTPYYFVVSPIEGLMENDETSLRIPTLCHSEYPKCRVTLDESYANQSMAYVTHWRDYVVLTIEHNKTVLELPANSQIPNILFNIESPAYTSFLPNSSKFHLVATYRRDSDIYSPYGRVVKRTNGTSVLPDFSFNKTLPVTWMACNCDTASNREHYVDRLQKHIRVDIYGGCGQYECPKNGNNNEECLSELSKKYYFYLAFENSFDRDYMTEKVYNLGAHSMIPVVYGGANYTALLPPNSFINAMEYSPRNLARLLRMLMKNKRKYNEYFRWRRDYYMQSFEPFAGFLCKVCSLVHHRSSLQMFNPTYEVRNPDEINQWFFGKNYRKKSTNSSSVFS